MQALERQNADAAGEGYHSPAPEPQYLCSGKKRVTATASEQHVREQASVYASTTSATASCVCTSCIWRSANLHTLSPESLTFLRMRNVISAALLLLSAAFLLLSAALLLLSAALLLLSAALLLLSAALLKLRENSLIGEISEIVQFFSLLPAPKWYEAFSY